MLLVSLSVLVIADAGQLGQLVWLGAGLAALFLAIGVVGESFAAVHTAIALLGAMFLLREDSRLLLAAPYGAGLLLIDDLASQAIELSGVSQIRPAVVAVRSSAALALAAIGACASAAAALAVTAGPGRSVGMTALGALAAVAAVAAIVRPARRRYAASAAEDQAGASVQANPAEGSTE